MNNLKNRECSLTKYHLFYFWIKYEKNDILEIQENNETQTFLENVNIFLKNEQN